MEPPEPKTVLSLMAHPDDAEFLCGGTLLFLSDAGWRVHIATATPGDCGTATLGPEEISAIRRREGAAAAALLGGTYHCLEERDLLVFYNERLVRKANALLRRVRPHLVITHNPRDYMTDHEQISQAARAACFNAPVPNAPIPSVPPEDLPEGAADRAGSLPADPPLSWIPHLYYADPAEGVDPLGRLVEPDLLIDVSSCLERKEALLACHVSQREWLRRQHGMDEYLETMRRWGSARGRRIGVRCAEGFRQHLGHAYPREDLLRSVMGPAAHRLRDGGGSAS